MTTQFTKLAARAATDGVISPEELLGLRRQGWGDGIVTREEAEAIIAINEALSVRDEEWCNFFVEAIGEFVLNGTKPRLQCSREEAEWLIAQIDHDGAVESMAELEAIVRIIERAENVPFVLKDYVLAQVEREVLTGTGPTRCGGELSATHISSAECRILRRVIFASGGHGAAVATESDAELLFRLKDATLEDENAPEWGDLFVDGVTNFLRGFSVDNAQLSHERKLELVKFIQAESKGHAAFIGAMASSRASLGDRMRWALEHLKGSDGPQNDYTADAAAGHEVTASEQSWLDRKLDEDGQIDALEARVIERLAELDAA